jgi:hypothetical protein
MEYWYHSIDQYATIDNPAMIDKALEVSGASKLVFVGHSQVRLGRLEGGNQGSSWQPCGALLSTQS